MRRLLLCASLGLVAAAPSPTPLPPPIEPPQDRAFTGTIDLHVDATDLDHHVFAVTERLPVVPGPLTLLYPKWIPGTHGPEGPISALAGLRIEAAGREIPWQRDTVDIYAFHVTVPQGADHLTLRFQYLSPVTNREGDVVMTSRMLGLQWHQEILYPAGYFVRDIEVAPSLTLPEGWQSASALTAQKRDGGTVTFQPEKLDVLLDSPVYAGQYFARYDLAPVAKVPAHLDVVADAPEDLPITPDYLEKHRALVAQAARNFASQHYDHFDFLLALSSTFSFHGLEHHRSSENQQPRDYFTHPEHTLLWRDLLPHEYTHSWDGKFRRPADLWSPDYTVVPERDSLLWVYEGQTEYWGQVLAARAGLTTAENFRDFLALQAASLSMRAGRDWRPVQDTTNDPILNQRRPLSWGSWSREEDYYFEGALLWLDADTLIRQKTRGAKSLTDFAQAFFGVDDGNYGERTYNFNDITAALNAILPYDWPNFLRTRLDSTPNPNLLDGIERAGWRLAYTDQPSAVQKNAESAGKFHDFTYSLGLSLAAEGAVGSVLWGGPAYRAGLSRGVKIIAVNGLALDGAGTLEDAVKQAKSTKTPIELIVQDGKQFRTVSINYHNGLRYPHLERVPGTPDMLDLIVKPLQ